jgi:hypothetical protein
MLYNMNLYTIFDNVACQSGFVFESINDEVAIRNTRKQVLEDKKDYDLYRIGSFDHKTMKMNTEKEPVQLMWIEEQKEERI